MRRLPRLPRSIEEVRGAITAGLILAVVIFLIAAAMTFSGCSYGCGESYDRLQYQQNTCAACAAQMPCGCPGGGTPPAVPTYRNDIKPILLLCSGCHSPGNVAAGTQFVLSSPQLLPASDWVDYFEVRSLSNLQVPLSSALLQQASGVVLHSGGVPWPVGGAAYNTYVAWLNNGAQF